MGDRLKDIKEVLHAKVYGPAISDVSWLVSEVEQLRETIAVLSDPEVMQAIAAKLVEISERLGNRKDSDAQDIDWLIMQVALPRRHNELLHTQVAALMEKLIDLEQHRG